MTTGPETIAAAIRDSLHELAEAIASRETPRMGPRSDEQAAVVHKDPPSVQDAVERAARIIRDWERDPDANWSVAAQALADAGLLATPRPMTVGQLTAEHIGKRVNWTQLPLPVTATRIEHGGTGATVIFTAGGQYTLRSSTPCEVLDD